ncbi:MAG TPA: phospho-N-acetylmuramoyl-pentapeptide-transferase, partial [Oligoflexia bacterium]|nr:phospho-N-acetylmuramoyl-pentapeptide-transferase [Oligoflexia bacterium]
MLYHLLYPLREHFSALNVLRYLTFRSLAAFFIAISLVLLFQPRFIAWFRQKQLGQPIREDGPQSHLSKKGTPTMGGVVVVLAVVVSTLLFADLSSPYIWSTVGVTLLYAVLGFVDDYRKVSRKNSKGLSAKGKLFWQFLIAAVFLRMLLEFRPEFSTVVTVPFFKNMSFELGPRSSLISLPLLHISIDIGLWRFIAFAALVIVSCANAVNLTDGLDGLVIGPVMTVALAYGVFAYVAGNAKYAEYLQVVPVAGAGDLAIFAAAVFAAGLGFLWFNAFPAQVFMGDVGSLSLGGALGMLAVITKQELVMVIAGGVFVLEALSVIAQVTSFKLTGKRVLRMAPLHHHYELKGLAEPKIIV